MFSDVLMTVDFDRTFTGPDSKIPQRNLDAVAFFMENGGTFTINTGRSVGTFHKYLEKIPVNAPVLLYNGSARWENGKLTQLKLIDLDMWPTLQKVRQAFPNINLEVQGTQCHHLIDVDPAYTAFCQALGWQHQPAQPGDDLGPFLKFALAGTPRKNNVATLFDCTEAELAQFDAAYAMITELWGDKVEVYRAAPRIIDVHAKGVSKAGAALNLKKSLDRKWLVCAGDASNDTAMLDAADFAYCPADAIIADRYENVCKCADGAVADVIYEKIPQIIK